MSETIPDDIMKAAERAFKYGFGLRHEVAIKAIAYAIYLERRRHQDQSSSEYERLLGK